MLKRIKEKYNAWLFGKYGFDRGAFFEKIPTVYKLLLFSPSMYAIKEGEEVSKQLQKGINEIVKGGK